MSTTTIIVNPYHPWNKLYIVHEDNDAASRTYTCLDAGCRTGSRSWCTHLAEWSKDLDAFVAMIDDKDAVNWAEPDLRAGLQQARLNHHWLEAQRKRSAK